jgi:glycosyltransferase involved in cell wall biosynthesis
MTRWRDKMVSAANALLFPAIEADIVKMETNFPFETPYGFTNAEVNYLFETMPTLISYTPPLTKRKRYPEPVGVTKEKFARRKKAYLEHYRDSIGPRNEDKINYLDPGRRLRARLAYTTFVSQAYSLGKLFEKMQLPFVFNLYPGGGFGLNNEWSDGLLRKIFSSPCFRKVIVNNDVTYDYLIEKDFCPKESIAFLFGVPVQFRKHEIDLSQKRYYGKDKDTFDLCFVAFKYDEIGRSKGYDLFIEAAKTLASNPGNADIRFHVVGDFDETVIDVGEIRDKITFYGVRTAEWLHAFYYTMDIAVAPVRPFSLYEGGFDGYPMCFEQGVCGVAMFQSDELNINRDYRYYKEDEVVNIKLDAQDIASKVQHYFSNPEKLYALAEKGRQRTQSLCGLEERTEKVKQILLAAAAGG